MLSLPSGLLTRQIQIMFDDHVLQKKCMAIGQFDMNIAQKSRVGISKKLKLPHIFNDNFSRGPNIIIFAILPLLRRNITLKRIIES
jgi:hypothetical protein